MLNYQRVSQSMNRESEDSAPQSRRDHSREGFVSVLFAQNAKLDQARPTKIGPTFPDWESNMAGKYQKFSPTSVPSRHHLKRMFQLAMTTRG